MSAIGNRLVPDPEVGVTLNALVFGTCLMGYLLGDVTGGQALGYANQHIAENQGEPLTAQEQADVLAMKTHYDGLAAAARPLQLHRLMAYSQILQNGLITVDLWDLGMGL